MTDELREPFICPRCGAKSWHLTDKREGYCARCHDWTAAPGGKPVAEDEPLETFWADSIYGAMTDQPLVKLQWEGEAPHIMSPDQARALAASVYEAAEAADVDAFVYQWLRGKVQLAPAEAAAALRDFRDWRKHRPSRPPEGQARG